MRLDSRAGEAMDARDEVGAEGPHPVDRHVGLRIRMRRKELGVSQERLAEALGLTFQQVQKYERAANRVSASKLFEIARALNIGVGYFYEGLATAEELDAPAGPTLDGQAFLNMPEGAELAALFPRLPRARVRRKVVELVRALAEAEADGPAPAAEPATGLRVLTYAS